MVWELALESIQNEIADKGYYHWTKTWPDFKEKYEIIDKGRAPYHLSIAVSYTHLTLPTTPYV